MANTRRSFLHGGAALAAGLAGGGATLTGQQAAQPQSTVQVPKMKFGGAEISRMVLGVNPFYGYAHYNNNFSVVMKEWYTQEKVCAIMHQCNRYGINAFNYVHMERAPLDLARFREEGWDVDFYAGCVYNRTRTSEEWKKALNGEIVEMPGEIYLQSDPPRMYRVMRQTRKPCFAFKILAAGRIPDRGVDQAFRTAFESLSL